MKFSLRLSMSLKLSPWVIWVTHYGATVGKKKLDWNSGGSGSHTSNEGLQNKAVG